MNITLTLFSCIEHRPSEISYFLFSQGRVERRVSKKFQIPPPPPLSLHYIEASTIVVNHYTTDTTLGTRVSKVLASLVATNLRKRVKLWSSFGDSGTQGILIQAKAEHT